MTSYIKRQSERPRHLADNKSRFTIINIDKKKKRQSTGKTISTSFSNKQDFADSVQQYIKTPHNSQINTKRTKLM